MTAPLVSTGSGLWTYSASNSRWNRDGTIVVPPSVPLWRLISAAQSGTALVTPPGGGGGGGTPTDAQAVRDLLVAGTYKPGPETTGPVSGTTLTQFGSDGPVSTDYFATKDNDIIEGMEIWGSVNIRAYQNVKIRNCVVHGTLKTGGLYAAIDSSNGNGNGCVISDTKIVQRVDRHNVWCGGMRGGNWTLRNVEIAGFPDGISFTLPIGQWTLLGVWIHDGWFEEWTKADFDAGLYPAAGSYYTHVDGIQFHVGKDFLIRGCNLGGVRTGDYLHWNNNTRPSQKDLIRADDDMYNTGMLIKQEVNQEPGNRIERAVIENNWLQGGRSTFNIVSADKDTAGNFLKGSDGITNTFKTVYFRNNIFPYSIASQMYMLDGPGLGVLTGNTHSSDGVTSNGISCKTNVGY